MTKTKPGFGIGGVKYSATFLVLAGLVAYFAWLLGEFAPPLAWVSLSFGLVALAYATNSPSLLGKRRHGGFGAWRCLPSLPYLSLTWATWSLARLISNEDAYNEISSKLVIGRRMLGHEKAPVVDIWIDLTCEIAEPRAIRGMKGYRAFPILDAHVPASAELDHLLQHVGSKRVFVHCAQGHGRTGLVAAAILLARSEAASVAEAIQILQTSRPKLRLNTAQERWLSRYFDARVDQHTTEADRAYSRSAGT